MVRIMMCVLAACLMCACQQETEIDYGHEPILQVDAVFYTDAPLPQIEIKRSLEASGNKIYEIPASEVFVSGAEVKLWRNGTLLEVKEIEMGVYQPSDDDAVRAGDVFRIEVQDGERSVWAVAEVPSWPVDEIEIYAEPSANDVYYGRVYNASWPSYATDSLDGYRVFDVLFRVKVPFVAPYVSLYAEMAIDSSYFFNNLNKEYRWHSRYLGENYSGFEEILHLATMDAFVISDEYPVGQQHAAVSLEVVVPEEIYLDYYNIVSDVIAPVTITNVNGGVGLFFGAIRYEVIVDVPFEVKEEVD